MKNLTINALALGVLALAVSSPAYAISIAAPEPDVAGGLAGMALLGLGVAAIRRFKR